MQQQFPPPNYNSPYPPPPGGGYQPFNHGYNPYPGGIGMQTEVPGAGTAQICGIIGLILFFNLIGIICNIIAIVKGGSAMEEFKRYPGRYTEASFRKAKSGRTCGVVGLCLFPAAIIIIVGLVAATVGF